MNIVLRAILALVCVLSCGSARAQETLFADGLETMAVTAWKTPTSVAWSVADATGATIGFDSDPSPTWAAVANDGNARALTVLDGVIPSAGGSITIELTFDPDTEIPVGSVPVGIEVEVYARTSSEPAASWKQVRAETLDWRSPITFAEPPFPVGSMGPFAQRLYGGPLDQFSNAAVFSPRWIGGYEFTNVDTWQIFSPSIALTLFAPATDSMLVEIDRVAFRLHYFPAPNGIAQRFNVGATVTATVRRMRQAIGPNTTGGVMQARVTMNPTVNARRNVASRIYDGPTKVGATMGVHMTRSVGGVRTTYLFPEPKVAVRMTPTLRRGFGASASVGATLGATLNARRQALKADNPFAIGAKMAVTLVGGRLAIPATAVFGATMTAVMTRARTLAATANVGTTMAASVRAMRPVNVIASTGGRYQIGATMAADLRARRPVVPGSALGVGTTMTVALGTARKIAATMAVTSTLRGNEGRATPDVSNLFWRPSVESIDSDPWGNDIDSDPWSNDLDGD